MADEYEYCCNRCNDLAFDALSRVPTIKKLVFAFHRNGSSLMKSIPNYANLVKIEMNCCLFDMNEMIEILRIYAQRNTSKMFFIKLVSIKKRLKNLPKKSR
jgi:hypothetical protein